MTPAARTFVLREDFNARTLYAFLRQNWEAMAAAGKPLAVRVSEYRRHRSTDQNSLMWAWLKQISEEAYVGGRRYSDDVWNLHLKEALLPEETAAGKSKWAYMPDDSRRLSLSTSDLNVSEMSDYMDKLAAYAATELGVELK